jgi:hypothetical protein
LVASFVIIYAALLPILLHGHGRWSQPVEQHGAALVTAPQSRSAADGLRRAAGLLPLSRRLTLEVLGEMADRYHHVGEEELQRAREQVEAVKDVRLDAGLGELGEFDEDEPTVVKVGEGYARSLASDDEAVVLLAHELTHAAAVGGGLNDLVEVVAAEAGRRAGVFAAEGQKQDLFCDYVGEQALKRFARLRPDGERVAGRVGRAFGGIGQEDADGEDEEHLSPALTWRALRGLDRELE